MYVAWFIPGAFEAYVILFDHAKQTPYSLAAISEK